MYHGGSGIDRLRHENICQDTRFPEDWIASCIEGNGRVYHSPGHGIGRIEVQGEIYSFPEFLHEYAKDILGDRHLQKYGENPAVLTKLLDSAEWLPLQVHPTREDAMRLWGVPYGKTEAWLVLATRQVNGEEPYLYVGFNEILDREVFYRESVNGEYRQGLDMLHKLKVKPGDVIMIHGGLPHAIGPGVTMVEVMEPTDLMIVPEIDCCGVRLDEQKRFAGLGVENGMLIFDWQVFSLPELRRYITPQMAEIQRCANGVLQSLIPMSFCGYFEVQELFFSGEWQLEHSGCFRIGVAVEGDFKVNGLAVAQGESFMVPYNLEQCNLIGNGRIMFILPPT